MERSLKVITKLFRRYGLEPIINTNGPPQGKCRKLIHGVTRELLAGLQKIEGIAVDATLTPKKRNGRAYLHYKLVVKRACGVRRLAVVEGDFSRIARVTWPIKRNRTETIRCIGSSLKANETSVTDVLETIRIASMSQAVAGYQAACRLIQAACRMAQTKFCKALMKHTTSDWSVSGVYEYTYAGTVVFRLISENSEFKLASIAGQSKQHTRLWVIRTAAVLLQKHLDENKP